MKTTGEYIEYCEDEVKMEIKREDNDLELSQNRKNLEYFEEDVKEEVVDDQNPNSTLKKRTCDICSKSYKTQGHLKAHIKSVHEKLKHPCNLCEHKAATQGCSFIFTKIARILEFLMD